MQTVPALLRSRARDRATHPFLKYGEESLTYGEVDARTDALARALMGAGVSLGTHVGVALPNGIVFPLIWLALAKLGAVMMPLSLKYRAHDLAHVVRDSQVSLVITDAEHLPSIRSTPSTPPTILAEELFAGAVPDTPVDAAITADTPLNIQYTSGTTGLPKGCIVTHEYWLLTAAAEGQAARCTRDDVFISVQPFYYMDPQWVTILAMLHGATSVILPRFSASTLWNDVRRYGATVFYMLGTMPLLLLKQPENPTIERNHSMRVALCSGIPPERHAEIERRFGFPWRETFGSTESGADLVVELEDAATVGTGSMGRPIPTKLARVVGPDGRPVDDLQHGELVVRGKPMMLGYWNNPDATREKIRDGWLRTGDIVYRDERGHFHLVGRLKDMIRRGGENVAAAEVETVLATHDDVLEAAVVGVPDELRGEEVLAYVKLREGQAPAPDDLLAFVRGRLADYKVPRFLQYVDSFPKTPSERIAKSRLHELSGARYDSTTRSWS